MKITKLLSLVLVISLFSCSKDDKAEEVINEYPRISNIKFEAISTPTIIGYVDVIVNNDTYTGGDMPFNHTISQMEIEKRTFLKMDFEDHVFDNTYPYDVVLKIYENNKVIAEKTFTITEEWQKNYLEYTFE